MNNCIVHFAIVVFNTITTLFRCLKRWRLSTYVNKKQLQLSNIISFAISVASLQQCLLSFSIKLEPITSTKQVLPRPQMISIVRMKLLLLSSTTPALGHFEESHTLHFPFYHSFTFSLYRALKRSAALKAEYKSGVVQDTCSRQKINKKKGKNNTAEKKKE